jgi:hypothetical protein
MNAFFTLMNWRILVVFSDYAAGGPQPLSSHEDLIRRQREKPYRSISGKAPREFCIQIALLNQGGACAGKDPLIFTAPLAFEARRVETHPLDQQRSMFPNFGSWVFFGLDQVPRVVRHPERVQVMSNGISTWVVYRFVPTPRGLGDITGTNSAQGISTWPGMAFSELTYSDRMN